MKTYHDNNGNELTLAQMILLDPERAAARMRIGEEAIEIVYALAQWSKKYRRDVGFSMINNNIDAFLAIEELARAFVDCFVSVLDKHEDE